MDKNQVLKKLNILCEKEGLEMQLVDFSNLVFEERILMNCFYCGRYNNNWRCPPRIPALDFPKMINEFDNIAFVYKRYEITQENREAVRVDSTNHLHKSLLAMENVVFKSGIPTTLSFIGGSCKLCKNGCGEARCNNPYLSRTPLEATGMNIEKSAANYDIRIIWPTSNHILRLGMLLW